jgi:glycosyltransferase involved in cell wall biosynthesis
VTSNRILKVAVASGSGNPLEPGTWSGTPRRISEALCNNACEIVGIDASLLNSPRLYVYAALNLLSGYGCRDVRRGPAARRYSGRRVQSAAARMGADVVLHFGDFTLPVPGPSSKVAHYLYEDSTWDLFLKHSPYAAGYPKGYGIACERQESAAARQVRHIFTTAEYVRQNLISHYRVDPNKVTTVPTGAGALEPFYGSKDYSRGSLLLVAQHSFEAKGGSLLVEAFKVAQRRVPKLALTIVGPDSLRAELAAVANVTVTGFIPRAELQRLFNEASLYAMPALYEPYGMVYLEALACKTPILGLDRHALPEFTDGGKFGFLAAEARVELVADQIAAAFSDPDRLRRMGEAGQRFCLEKYQWAAAGQAISRIFHDDGEE